MKKIIIAGGTGFLGETFIRQLINEHKHTPEIIVLTRRRIEHTKYIKYIQWDGMSLGPWCNHLHGADVLLNLSGRSVNCRYTQKNKEEIYNSRIDSTYILGEAVKQCKLPPKVWVNMSTATIYRDENQSPNDEYHGIIGDGFSVDVARNWEDTFLSTPLFATRKVIIRTAIALGERGDVFKIYKSHIRMFISGKHGNGKQMVSWIHETDFYRAVMHLINNETCEGVYNLAAPHPISDQHFMETFRKAMGYQFGLPLPAWMLHIGAFFLRTETELILKSRWVIPTRLLESGFEFHFPTIEGALTQLVEASSESRIRDSLPIPA